MLMTDIDTIDNSTIFEVFKNEKTSSLCLVKVQEALHQDKCHCKVFSVTSHHMQREKARQPCLFVLTPPVFCCLTPKAEARPPRA